MRRLCKRKGKEMGSHLEKGYWKVFPRISRIGQRTSIGDTTMMSDFRERIKLSCSSCGGIEMIYDPHYISWNCPKCNRITSARMKRDGEE